MSDDNYEDEMREMRNEMREEIAVLYQQHASDEREIERLTADLERAYSDGEAYWRNEYYTVTERLIAERDKYQKWYSDKCDAYHEASDAVEKQLDDIERLTAERDRLKAQIEHHTKICLGEARALAEGTSTPP